MCGYDGSRNCNCNQGQIDKLSTIDMETIISKFYHIIQMIATHSTIHLVQCCHRPDGRTAHDTNGNLGEWASCDVGKAREGLENELWRRWSVAKLGEWASCDVGKVREGLENELWRRWSDGKLEAVSKTSSAHALPTGQSSKICESSYYIQKICVLEISGKFLLWINKICS